MVRGYLIGERVVIPAWKCGPVPRPTEVVDHHPDHRPVRFGRNPSGAVLQPLHEPGRVLAGALLDFEAQFQLLHAPVQRGCHRT